MELNFVREFMNSGETRWEFATEKGMRYKTLPTKGCLFFSRKKSPAF